MKQQLITAALMVALVAGCASNASNDSASKQAATETAKTTVSAGADGEVVAMNAEDDKDRVVCRQITPTGSHRKKMICRTVGDMDKDRRSAQDALRQKQGGSLESPDDL